MIYAEFWRRYLAAHQQPATRKLHYCGSLLALAALLGGVATLDWRWAAIAPVIGYSFAWGAHFLVEGNRPQTFGHPVWALVSDYRMLALWLAGRLTSHLAEPAEPAKDSRRLGARRWPGPPSSGAA